MLVCQILGGGETNIFLGCCEGGGWRVSCGVIVIVIGLALACRNLGKVNLGEMRRVNALTKKDASKVKSVVFNVVFGRSW
jgi:hypothetical protein